MHEEIRQKERYTKRRHEALQVILSGQPERRVEIEEPERGKLRGSEKKCLSTDHEMKESTKYVVDFDRHASWRLHDLCTMIIASATLVVMT